MHYKDTCSLWGWYSTCMDEDTYVLIHQHLLKSNGDGVLYFLAPTLFNWYVMVSILRAD